MKLKTTYGLLFLTIIALFIAPQIARSGLINRALPLLLYLIPILWITVLVKNITNPA